jgi:hypothetical protein
MGATLKPLMKCGGPVTTRVRVVRVESKVTTTVINFRASPNAHTLERKFRMPRSKESMRKLCGLQYGMQISNLILLQGHEIHNWNKAMKENE